MQILLLVMTMSDLVFFVDVCKARYIIRDELEGWVEKTIQASWRGYKSRTKKTHYKAYDNDELRLKNRPNEIPLERFKILLAYWNDETVQVW